MTTTAQPAAGTSLPSTSLTSGLVFCRNEADTADGTILAGSASVFGTPAYGTDADGRYKQFGSARQYWTLTSGNYGPEYTILHIVKFVSNSSSQMMSASDDNPPRDYQFSLNASGVPQFILFKETNSYVSTAAGPSAVNSSSPSAVVVRVRDNSGYYAGIYVDGSAGAEFAYGGTPETGANIELCSRVGASLLVSKLYFTAVWDRALSDSELTQLGSNPWSIFDESVSGATAEFTVTTADATFSGAGEVRPMASFSVTSAAATFSGSAFTGQAEADISAMTDDSTFSGSATGDTSSGTITTPALKNNTGTVLANETGITVYVYTPDTGALVVKKTGQTTNASGVLTVTDALIVASTLYRVVIVLGSGAEGMDKVTAA